MASKRISADYQVVKRYYFNDTSSVDLQVLAKLCCALNCNISDILEYNSLKVDKEGKNFEHTNHINI